MNREEQLRQMLVTLVEEYQAKAKPIVDELTAIEVLKPPRMFIIDLSQLMREVIDPLPPGDWIQGCGDEECEYCNPKKGTMQ